MLKELSTTLTTLGYGLITKTPDWGAMWNRVYTAAVWTPSDADATVADVANGKKFYSGDNRTIKMGSNVSCITPTPTPTSTPTPSYSLFTDQALCKYENSPSPCLAVQAAAVPASTWSNPTTDVWKDDRTGLYWSSNQTPAKTNNFTQISLNTCDFFNANPRGGYAGVDNDCGNAINYCAGLTFGGRSNWYLPTRAELLQAYNDNMYGIAGSAFTTTNVFWSSSEYSGFPTYAWFVNSVNGSTGGDEKTYGDSVRCVSRD
jgi:hypothetical protein